MVRQRRVSALPAVSAVSACRARGLQSAAAADSGRRAAGSTLLALTSAHGLDLTFHNGIFRGIAAFAIGVGLSVLLQSRSQARAGTPLPDLHPFAAQLAAFALLPSMRSTIPAGRIARRTSTRCSRMAPLVFALSFDRGHARRRRSDAPAAASWANGPTRSISARRRCCSSCASSSCTSIPPPYTLVLGRPWAAWDARLALAGARPSGAGAIALGLAPVHAGRAARRAAFCAGCWTGPARSRRLTRLPARPSLARPYSDYRSLDP